MWFHLFRAHLNYCSLSCILIDMPIWSKQIGRAETFITVSFAPFGAHQYFLRGSNTFAISYVINQFKLNRCKCGLCFIYFNSCVHDSFCPPCCTSHLHSWFHLPSSGKSAELELILLDTTVRSNKLCNFRLVSQSLSSLVFGCEHCQLWNIIFACWCFLNPEATIRIFLKKGVMVEAWDWGCKRATPSKFVVQHTPYAKSELACAHTHTLDRKTTGCFHSRHRHEQKTSTETHLRYWAYTHRCTNRETLRVWESHWLYPQLHLPCLTHTCAVVHKPVRCVSFSLVFVRSN